MSWDKNRFRNYELDFIIQNDFKMFSTCSKIALALHLIVGVRVSKSFKDVCRICKEYFKCTTS